MPAYAHVLSPGQFGSLPLPNRVLMPPMGTNMGTADGFYSPQEIAYYAARAAGGAGLVQTGVCWVASDLDPVPPGGTRIDTDDALPGATALADAIHAVGGRLAIQLTAGFGRNTSVIDPANPPISASENPHWIVPGVTCRPMTEPEIRTLIERFEAAAARVAAAGVDAIDIHGHTGYLIDQFLSSLWNRRTDQWGGSLENRARLAVEIVRAVRRGAPGLPISFRLTVDQRIAGGRSLDEAQRIAVLLVAAGVDVMQADDGAYDAMDYVFPPSYLGDACLVPAARAIKAVVHVPVVAVGNLTPEAAEAVLADGDADFVAVGRGQVADPEWVNKLAAGQRADIRPCIRCNALCIGNIITGRTLECAVNPQAGHETDRVLTRVAPDQRRTVVVVGGGPAGMEAARVAALRGHSVDLHERDDELGGVLRPAATASFKAELRATIGWWDQALDRLGVRVHLGSSISADSPELAAADDVILATGARPIVPPIPGIDGPGVVGVIEAHGDARLGHRVVVAGGGLSGADLALELAQDGHEVTLVEATDRIARDLIEINRITLLRELAAHDVRILVSHAVVAVDARGVDLVGPDGPVRVDGDLTVTAFGMRSDRALTQALAARATVRSIGDCVTPAKVGEAVHAAYLAAAALGD